MTLLDLIAQRAEVAHANGDADTLYAIVKAALSDIRRLLEARDE